MLWIDKEAQWALEAWNPQGWTREEIELSSIGSPVPAEFEQQRATAYLSLLKEKIEEVERNKKIPRSIRRVVTSSGEGFVGVR